MTKVKIEPGVCGLPTIVTAEADEDQLEVKLTVTSGCEAVQKMLQAVGDTFDPYELCLVKPGCGPLYAYASQNLPEHCSCPVIAGITKCAEAECGLALKKDATIHFLPDKE